MSGVARVGSDELHGPQQSQAPPEGALHASAAAARGERTQGLLSIDHSSIRRLTAGDLLRLLTLWFRYGGEPEVESTLGQGFELVGINMWLLVIPQIIARISTGNPRVRKSVHTLLLRILNSMRVHCDALVEQALLVSNELIRVAILWGEMWHEALEQAYRRYFYFEHQGVDEMLAVLSPLYRLLEEGAATASEHAFVSAYGSDLMEFSAHGSDVQLQLAWQRLLMTHPRLPQEAKMLQLDHVSPQLLQANNLELAVPGKTLPPSPHRACTYRADREVVAIARFAPSIKVMASKQRPRRLAVMGSDGEEYVFLLKGHEDLRQARA
ncbi:MAG: hypothetical protein SGPRY_002008 [Prymnesium sp.]